MAGCSDRLGERFVLLRAGDGEALPEGVDIIELEDAPVALARYGLEAGGAYLIRPDHYVAARWKRLDVAKIAGALARAKGGC
jgi:3-(3-hydroxy-phenyl)propionate hydroxylase